MTRCIKAREHLGHIALCSDLVGVYMAMLVVTVVVMACVIAVLVYVAMVVVAVVVACVIASHDGTSEGQQTDH